MLWGPLQSSSRLQNRRERTEVREAGGQRSAVQAGGGEGIKDTVVRESKTAERTQRRRPTKASADFGN